MSPCVIKPRAKVFPFHIAAKSSSDTALSNKNHSDASSAHRSPLNLAQKRLRAARRVDKPDLLPTQFRTDLLFDRKKEMSSKVAAQSNPGDISSVKGGIDAQDSSNTVFPAASTATSSGESNNSIPASDSTHTKARTSSFSGLHSLLDDKTKDGKSTKGSPFDHLFLGDSEDEVDGGGGDEAFDFDFHRAAKDGDSADEQVQCCISCLLWHFVFCVANGHVSIVSEMHKLPVPRKCLLTFERQRRQGRRQRRRRGI